MPLVWRLKEHSCCPLGPHVRSLLPGTPGPPPHQAWPCLLHWGSSDFAQPLSAVSCAAKGQRAVPGFMVMAVVSEVTLKSIDCALSYREVQPTCEGGDACENED